MAPNLFDDEQARLNHAFKLMRRAGLIARQKFSCCVGCGCGEIAEAVRLMPEAKRAKLKGATFYSRQQEPYSRTGKFQPLFLTFGPVEYDGQTVGLSTLEVGKLIAQALKDAGLEVDWNGSAETSIRVAGIGLDVLAERRLIAEAGAGRSTVWP